MCQEQLFPRTTKSNMASEEMCYCSKKQLSNTSFFKMFNDDGGAKDSGRAKNGKKEWRKDKHGTIPFRFFFFSWEVGGYGRGLELEPPRREARQL